MASSLLICARRQSSSRVFAASAANDAARAAKCAGGTRLHVQVHVAGAALALRLRQRPHKQALAHAAAAVGRKHAKAHDVQPRGARAARRALVAARDAAHQPVRRQRVGCKGANREPPEL